MRFLRIAVALVVLFPSVHAAAVGQEPAPKAAAPLQPAVEAMRKSTAKKLDQESPSSEAESKSYPVLSGVGLALTAKDGRLYVGRIVPNSPADKSGLIRDGAQLVSVEINGKKTPLDNMTIGEAASLVRGPVGTKLVLTVIPPGDSVAIKVPLVRAALEQGNAPASYKSFIGKPMPELRLVPLDGKKESRLADYRGKIVVLDFWASWCPTCYPPLSKLQTLAASNPRWQEKVQCIAVTVDADPSDAVKVIELKKWKNMLHRAVDVEKLNSIGISVIPVVVVLAPDGTIAAMAGAHALDIEKEVAALIPK